ncbi:hypothetical protein K439DRAFT_1624033 [Ramaria rubella]|nr:hypothetical protein K439DRAFT_1624033 [Ramaria rubella]
MDGAGGCSWSWRVQLELEGTAGVCTDVHADGAGGCVDGAGGCVCARRWGWRACGWGWRACGWGWHGRGPWEGAMGDGGGGGGGWRGVAKAGRDCWPVPEAAGMDVFDVPCDMNHVFSNASTMRSQPMFSKPWCNHNGLDPRHLVQELGVGFNKESVDSPMSCLRLAGGLLDMVVLCATAKSWAIAQLSKETYYKMTVGSPSSLSHQRYGSIVVQAVAVSFKSKAACSSSKNSDEHLSTGVIQDPSLALMTVLVPSCMLVPVRSCVGITTNNLTEMSDHFLE